MHMLLLKENIIQAGQGGNPLSSFHVVGCKSCLYFQSSIHSLGKVISSHCTAGAAHVQVTLSVGGSYVSCKVPSFGRTLHSTNTCPPPQLFPGSCPTLSLGPCGISHTSARTPCAPIFCLRNVPPTLKGLPSNSPRKGLPHFPILPSSAFHKSSPTPTLVSHTPPSPLPSEGPHVPQRVAGALSMLYFPHPYVSNAPSSQAHAKYSDTRSHFGRWVMEADSKTVVLPLHHPTSMGLPPPKAHNHAASNTTLKIPYSCQWKSLLNLLREEN